MKHDIYRNELLKKPVSRFLIRRENFGGVIFDRHQFKQYTLTPFALDLLLQLQDTPTEDILRFLKKIAIGNFEMFERVISFGEEIGLITNQRASFDFVGLDDCGLDMDGALTAPIRIFLNLNENCNYQCRHCCVKATPNAPSFSKEKALDLCHEMAGMGVREIALVGGEPLLYPFLFDFLETSAELGMVLTMATNGSLLDRKMAQSLAKYQKNIRYIHVSLEGTREINDYIRGQGAFEKGVRALKYLNEAGFEATAQITITKLLIDHEQALINALFENGIYRLSASGLRPVGNALENQELLLDWQAEREVQKKLRDVTKNAGMLFFSSEPDAEISASLWDYLPLDLCGAGRLVMSISGDGSVYPCTFMKDYYQRVNLQPDNVYQKPLMEIWRNSNLFKFTRNMRHRNHCIQCAKYGQSCPGQCPSVLIEQCEPKLHHQLICSKDN